MQRNSKGFIQFLCGPLVKLTLLNIQWKQSKWEAYSFFTKLMCFVVSVSTLSTSLRAKIPACEMSQWERTGFLASLATQQLLIVWIIEGQI